MPEAGAEMKWLNTARGSVDPDQGSLTQFRVLLRKLSNEYDRLDAENRSLRDQLAGYPDVSLPTTPRSPSTSRGSAAKFRRVFSVDDLLTGSADDFVFTNVDSERRGTETWLANNMISKPRLEGEDDEEEDDEKEDVGERWDSAKRLSNGKVRRQSSSLLDENVFLEQGEDELADDNVFPEWATPYKRMTRASDASFTISVTAQDFINNVTQEDYLAQDACVLHPLGIARMTWDLVSFVCLLVQIWCTTFELFFVRDSTEPKGLDVLDDCITISFAVDIVLNFFTGFIHGDKVVMRHAAIISKYVRGWFWMDLIVTVPFDKFVASASSALSVTHIGRMAKLVRLLRYLRFLRFVRAVRLMRSVSNAYALLTTLKKYLYALMSMSLLTTLAHIHSCIFALVHPQRFPGKGSDIFQWYCKCLWQTYTAFAYGTSLDVSADAVSVWTLDMMISTERLALLAIAGVLLVYQAMAMLQHEAQCWSAVDDAILYMKSRDVNMQTQVEVVQQLSETSREVAIKKQFETWVSEGIPSEMHRKISQELWAKRLSSIALIAYPASINAEFLAKLAMLVREETLAAKCVLFVEGDVSSDAYCVLKGRVSTFSCYWKGVLPDFTDGMWLGEKALVNRTSKRNLTTVTKVTTSFVAVPADAFQGLLFELGLMPAFEEFCEGDVWQGMCGRCGQVGDHFANHCPIDVQVKHRKVHMCTSWLSNCVPSGSDAQLSQTKPFLRQETPPDEIAPYTALHRRGSYTAMDSSPPQRRDLIDFLREYHLQDVRPLMEEMAIFSLSCLEQLPDDQRSKLISSIALDSSVAASKKTLLFQIFAPANLLQFRKRHEARAKIELGTSGAREQHYIFLSHYKLTAGTEASLMRAELEYFFAENPKFVRFYGDVPVFLDSENLDDLDMVQLHVRRSHNLFLFLSEGVLNRVWVLVELVTAVREGINVLPVDINRAGKKFVLPDETFYEKLGSGAILSKGCMEVLTMCDITLLDVVEALRKVFRRICLPYSPQRSAATRRSEIEVLLRESLLRSPDDIRAPNIRRGRRESSHINDTRRQSNSSRPRSARTSAAESLPDDMGLDSQPLIGRNSSIKLGIISTSSF